MKKVDEAILGKMNPFGQIFGWKWQLIFFFETPADSKKTSSVKTVKRRNVVTLYF